MEFDMMKYKMIRDLLSSVFSKLGLGIILTILLLILFTYLENIDSSILKLESRWITIAFVPIIIALLVGGYIHKFKGFGLEIEARLKEPAKRIDLQATDACSYLMSTDKGSYYHLTEEMDENEKNNIEKIAFIEGRKDYYGTLAISLYLDQLPNLKYIEIKSEKGRFKGLLPIRALRFEKPTTPEESVQEGERINEFIESIENSKSLKVYRKIIITSTVQDNDSLLTVLEKVRDQKLGIIPMLESTGHMIGVVERGQAEKVIADAVLSAKGMI